MTAAERHLIDLLREGTTLLRAGRLAEAAQGFRAALRLKPDLPEAQGTLGAILGALGQLDQAELHLREALRLRPASPDAHGNLGNLLRELGRLPEAERSLRRAVRLRPVYPDAHNNLGATLRGLGRPAEAEACLRVALRQRPAYPEALANLARLLREQGRPEEAEAPLRAAAALRPGAAPLQASLGALLRELGQPADAEAVLRAALRLRPGDAETLTEIGNALHDLGRHADARAHFREALRARPDHPGAHLGLGVAAGTLGDFPEAERHLREALRLRPDLPEAHNSLGSLQRDLGRLPEAEASLREALRLRPGYPEAWTNLGFVLLQAGRFAEGWAAHEHRWRARPWRSRSRGFDRPAWDGGPLAGRTLLLHAEQGLGDTLQFCRYAPLIRHDGGRVLLETPGPLRRLLAGLPGVAVLQRGASLPPFDLHCPLMSLPHRFGTTPGTILAAVPYLHADPADVAVWRARLGTLPPGPRIGLVWAGDPGMAADGRRSLSLEALAPLADAGGVRFVSLQKGPAASQPRPPGLDLHDPTDALHDFADTAALVEALDLVIGVDTAVVHLAGALGRPVWLLNRADTCWRWLAGRDDSPWYPTLRLFRQTSPGDWAGPVVAVRDALLQWTGERA